MVPKAKKSKKIQVNKYEEIQKDLAKQRAVLLEEAGELIAEGLNPTKENIPDMSDQASAEADQYFSLRLREREQKLLIKIDEALERITRGTFGNCERCGKEIGLKRLQARPVTTLCIDCKTKQEEDEKIR
jgi:DnaK suppressor protein